MIGGRLTGAVVLAASLWVGHLVTSELDINEVNTDPFLRSGTVGEPVHLDYADVEVTDVEPAQYIAPTDKTELARIAGGVFVVVVTKVTATREAESFLDVHLVDDRGRVFLRSAKADCAGPTGAKAAVPDYAMFCFDVPKTALAGLRLRMARGSDIYDTTRGDAMADVDLGISRADAEDWAETTTAYGQEKDSDRPIELQEITLTQVDS
ncbi:hypothetical protein G5V58_01095 [Nocardioides anomalus]|uniref:DUF4352 domain-containing protein n=1 Tax=Nocardioides anomalus TaxID=2712223 RepID=A0A6G6W880_9ACTN|nr:hypothetical protein [Nocardioides anomalus]QIG41551.1 hypothetical protein G5V58_01095 [Nocardioides anomalus]